ncbi:MAG: ABC transporter ATP-binding protein [Hyphomicrobiales bacterium]|nr:ABC transporter ATP-binding protein [Hyphomicrobiales bacterium]MBV9115215.1 ABC transporter ATP-binding protein [Hyphomicrobiales bacterium]
MNIAAPAAARGRGALAGTRAFDELRLEGVRRDFGTVNALRDLTLTIPRGQFVALLGPSGCGKSTALNCIAGLLPVTGGSIWLDDRRIDTRRAEERGFGMVFQNYALFPHMTVRKNIGFGLRMRSVPAAEIERRVHEALRLVRLGEHADKLPGQLSGGQQQRVAIARAIVIEPPLVLMDEPLSNLDAKLRLEMRQEIRRIHAQLGSTTIYVTHDQEEALSLADRIVVLRDGVIRQVGTPAELYGAPAHLDVADFMGYRNRIEGKLVRGDNDRARVEIGGAMIEGSVRGEPKGERVVAAIRPDDLVPIRTGEAGIAAVIEAIEYRGREFHGLARTAAGAELHFSSPAPLAVGAAVLLAADPKQVLIFDIGEA